MKLPASIAAWAYLGAGALATLIYAVSGSNVVRAVIACALSAGAVAAILTGIRRHRPEPALPWYLFAAAHTVYFAGWIFWEIPIVRQGAPPASFSLADLFFMAAYPLFALGLLLIVRERDPRSGGVVESAIIATTAALASWVFLLSPFVGDEKIGSVVRATQSGYAILDLLVFAVIARALLGVARGTSYLFLVLGLTCLLAADTAWNWLSLAGRYVAGTTYDLGWLAFMVLFGAAALHPSMREATEEGKTGAATRWLEVGLLATGTFMLAVGASFGSGKLLLAIGVVLAVLIVTRFVLLLRESAALQDRRWSGTSGSKSSTARGTTSSRPSPTSCARR